MSNTNENIMMGHGSGGTMMSTLLHDIMFEIYGEKYLARGDDAAVLDDLKLEAGERLAYSTDSFVVDPLFFKGGDIGHLCVCGTVNDLATSGAIPKYLSIGMIIEEGFAIDDLRKICCSIAKTCKEAAVEIVTGDTKVVEHGMCDGIYINTSGIGIVPAGINVSGSNCKPGDAIILSGSIGDHGMCIMSKRQGLEVTSEIKSDAAPLSAMVGEVLAEIDSVCALRDPTRGGIASSLNEFASASDVDIEIEYDKIPINNNVKSMCELLGLDPCHVANEGKMLFVVNSSDANKAVDILHHNKYGKDATVIGRVISKQSDKPRVSLITEYGTTRILDMLSGQQLPRIC